MRAAGSLLLAVAALAHEARAQSVSSIDVTRCAAIAADKNRLICYDQLARGAPTSEATSAAPPAPATPAVAPDQSFGKPKYTAAKPVEPSRMDAKVAEVTSGGARGSMILRLDNEQTWVLDEEAAPLRLGDAVIIKKAALGSFLMTTPTGRVFRVRRLR